MPAVSVVVPARDAAGTIGRTMACLARQDIGLEFEVVVVDDGSRDGTAEVAASAELDVRVVSQDRVGAAEARNRGVEEARAGVLAFLDADCFPEPGWLDAGVRALEEADLVQGWVTPEEGVPLGPFDRTLWVTVDIGLWQTANMFVRRELFERIGGFEDWLPVEIGKLMAEDVWFGWRAVRAGARTALSREAAVRHAVFPRGPSGYIAERRRLRYFPAIARKMPELRETMFHRRFFLSRRTAAFDLGVAGCAAALLARSPLPLVAWAPYARLERSQRLAGRGPRAAARVALADLAADTLSCLELVRGSVRSRTPLV